MQRNIYIAYALWFFSTPIGGGLHRIYCGKFFSGIMQIILFWAGIFSYFFLIGYVFLAFWGIWWLIDTYFTALMVENINKSNKFERDYEEEEKIKRVKDLYEMLQKGAITEAEYQARKEIIFK